MKEDFRKEKTSEKMENCRLFAILMDFPYHCINKENEKA